mgnify:CR=1 FL=1
MEKTCRMKMMTMVTMVMMVMMVMIMMMVETRTMRSSIVQDDWRSDSDQKVIEI